MALYQDWLEDSNAVRCTLVELQVYDITNLSNKTIYLSSSGYSTLDGVDFLPIIANSAKYTESLPIDGSASLSFGDLELHNNDGSLDTWLDSSMFIWVNKYIKIFYGDPNTVTSSISDLYTKFELVFNGVISDIDSKSRDTVNIKLRDKLQRLNVPLYETKIGTQSGWGGTGQQNMDTLRPLVFGEVHNIEPILLNPANMQYIFSDGSTERLVELRDNGIPIYNTSLPAGAVPNLTFGTFNLTSPLVGVCTLSAQGVKGSINLTTGAYVNTYSNNISSIIALLITQYGPVATRLSSSDLDLTNLLAFSTANTQYIGIFINQRENLLVACQSIAASIGAQIYVNHKGLVQILKIGSPSINSTINIITDSDIIFGSLSSTNKTEAISAIKIGYAKNWTIQNNLTTYIPEANKQSLASDWLSITQVDTSVQTLYGLPIEPTQKDTLLISTADAVAEANRLLAFYKVPKITYRFTGISRLLGLQLGQQVTLTHNRFGLSAGKIGQVISLSPDWKTSLIEVEVLI